MSIQSWRFADAPVEFRNLSTHGGGEQYVIVFPAHYQHIPSFKAAAWNGAQVTTFDGCLVVIG